MVNWCRPKASRRTNGLASSVFEWCFQDIVEKVDVTVRYVVAVICALLLSASVIAASVVVGDYCDATKMKYDKVELPELVLVLMRTADLFRDYGYILTLPISRSPDSHQFLML